MGYARFSGPAYGGVGVLATVRVSDISSGAGNGLSTKFGDKALNDDQRLGIEIVRRAVEAPIKQIVENAGADGAVLTM